MLAAFGDNVLFYRGMGRSSFKIAPLIGAQCLARPPYRRRAGAYRILTLDTTASIRPADTRPHVMKRLHLEAQHRNANYYLSRTSRSPISARTCTCSTGRRRGLLAGRPLPASGQHAHRRPGQARPGVARRGAVRRRADLLGVRRGRARDRGDALGLPHRPRRARTSRNKLIMREAHGARRAPPAFQFVTTSRPRSK